MIFLLSVAGMIVEAAREEYCLNVHSLLADVPIR